MMCGLEPRKLCVARKPGSTCLTHIAKYGSEKRRVWFILSKKINHISGEVKAVSALCILEENRSF